MTVAGGLPPSWRSSCSAGPAIVHMLRGGTRAGVVFPATHFLPAAPAAAVRLRRPSDLGLLLLRIAIVAAAVLAAAQPLVMTPWRQAQWNTRVARAVVVDTQPRQARGRRRAAGAAADAERLRTDGSWTCRCARRLDRAARGLRRGPRASRDGHHLGFPRGSIDDEAAARIPAGAGVRLIRAGTQPGAAARDAAAESSGFRGGVWQASARRGEMERASRGLAWRRRRDMAWMPR